jgi:hypothetical protein
MIRSRRGFKILCRLGIVAGLVIFATNVAQAENGSTWEVKTAGGTVVGIPGTNDLLPLVQIKSLENNSASLLYTTAGGVNVEILCQTAELLENVRMTANGGLSLGKALFHGCITKLNGTLSVACEPFVGANNGLIESKKATALIILHLTGVGTNVEPLLKITPDTGTEFASINVGGGCSLLSPIVVSGSLALKDPVGLGTLSVDHLFQQGALTTLTASGRAATLDGSFLLKMVGAAPLGHEGLQWQGLPTAVKP